MMRVEEGACLISPPRLIWTVHGGMDSRFRGHDGVVMRRAMSLFCRKTGAGRLETRRSQLSETGSKMNTHILYKKGQRSRTTTEDGGGAHQSLPRVVGQPWCATL